MKILFATDGSEGADAARELVLGLPLREHDQVIVLGVPVYGALFLGDASSSLTFDAVAWEREQVEGLVQRNRARFASRGVPSTGLVREGPVAEAILDAAREVTADLIVVGSRGLGRVGGALLGSVARAVARHSAVPVLVVRDRRVAPRRILAAVDGSEDSTAALDLLGELPLPRDCELILLHVMPDRSRDVPRVEDPAIADELRARLESADRERATRVLAQAMARLPGGQATNAYVDEGHVLEQILARARASGADLIVLGARGMTLGKGFLQGSVADRILSEAPCAVLVAKSRAPQARGARPDGRARAVAS